MKSIYRKKNRENIVHQLEFFECDFVKKRAREFYRCVKYQRKEEKQTKIIFSKVRYGQLLWDIQDGLQRCVEYFKVEQQGKTRERKCTKDK